MEIGLVRVYMILLQKGDWRGSIGISPFLTRKLIVVRTRLLVKAAKFQKRVQGNQDRLGAQIVSVSMLSTLLRFFQYARRVFPIQIGYTCTRRWVRWVGG